MAEARTRFGFNVVQSCFPIGPWTIKTRKGTIMQSKCTCKNTRQSIPNQEPNQQLEIEKESDMEPIESCDLCRYHEFLPLLHSMPDMLFNNNLFRLEHSSGVGIEFNPLDALRLIQETNDPLKVAVADGWQSARADCPFANKISRPFDWTFTTNYQGTLLSVIRKPKIPEVKEGPTRLACESTDRRETRPESDDPNTSSDESNPTPSLSDKSLITSFKSPDQKSERKCHTESVDSVRYSLWVEQTDERIDINKLKVKEDILFYDDITLYEDELADHGTAQFSVKVRVMPSSLFILARYYLRIDGVMARINDTRIYHELKKDYILREYTNREAKLSGLNLPISTLINPTELMNHLPLIDKRYEKLILPTIAA